MGSPNYSSSASIRKASGPRHATPTGRSKACATAPSGRTTGSVTRKTSSARNRSSVVCKRWRFSRRERPSDPPNRPELRRRQGLTSAPSDPASHRQRHSTRLRPRKSAVLRPAPGTATPRPPAGGRPPSPRAKREVMEAIVDPQDHLSLIPRDDGVARQRYDAGAGDA